MRTATSRSIAVVTGALLALTSASIAYAKPAPPKPVTPASPDRACTLSPSLTHPAGELTTCIAVGATLSSVPTVGHTAVLTVTVKAARNEHGTKVGIDLPTNLAFADGTRTTPAYNGSGRVSRSAPTALSLDAGQTRTFTRVVRATGAGFGEIAVTATDRRSAKRTDGGHDSIFLTTARSGAKSHLGADARTTSARQHTAPAHYTGAAPERASSTPLRAAPSVTRPASQRAARPNTAGTSCVTGGWYYVDQNGVTRPGHNVTVQILNSSNTVLASGFSGGDGIYNLCYNSGGVTTSVYTKFILSNGVWSVQDFSNNVYNYSSGFFSVADGTTYNRGGQQPGTAADQRAAHTSQEADDEWQWMYQFVPYQGGCWSPYDTTCQTLTIHWASDNTSQGTNWNPSRGVYLLASSPDTLDEPVHEFGHALMYELYGQTFPDLSCGSHDLFTTAKSTTCSWTEGWADWVATSVYNNTVWTYNGGFTRDFNVTWNEGLGYASGDQVEGRIVQAMRSLTDGTKGPWDQDAGEGGGIKDNSRWFYVQHTYRPNSFADVWNDRAAAGYDVSQTALSALYQGTIDYGFRNPLYDYYTAHYPEAVPDHNYSHTTTTGYWSVVAEKPDSGTDTDLQLYNDFGQSSYLTGSGLSGTATDFVAINSNSGHRALQTYYPRVHQYSGSGGYTIQEAQGQNILTNGSTTVFVTAGPVRVWDSYQTAGTPTYYRAVPSSSGQDLQLVSADPASDLVARSSTTQGVDPGYGSAATLSVSPSASGYAGLILLNNGLSSGNVAVYADKTAPTGTVDAPGGTHSRDITVTTSASDSDTGVLAMQLSTDGTFDTEPVLPYSTSASVHLDGSNGVKTVYARFENNAGMWSAPTTDTVNLALPPAITSVSPASGSTTGGQTVTITGTNFAGATGVRFSTTAATSYTVNSPTSITAKVPARAAGTVNVFVTTANGNSAVVAADQYTYASRPTITAVAPKAGPTGGGQTVTITGTGFTGASTVRFGPTNATSYTVVSSTKITAKTPARAAGVVNVIVTTAGGTTAIVTADQYTYAVAPAVTSVAPNTGTTAGGQTVTITGTGFTGATAVRFGPTAATSFTVVSATKITAKTPAHAAGTINVFVVTPGGTSAIASGDTYKFA